MAEPRIEKRMCRDALSRSLHELLARGNVERGMAREGDAPKPPARRLAERRLGVFVCADRGAHQPLHHAAAALGGRAAPQRLLEEPGGEELTLPSLRVTRRRIRFHNVRFGYAPDRTVLDGVSFEVEGGRRTAIVGPSGAGKTTVTDLLAVLYRTALIVAHHRSMLTTVDRVLVLRNGRIEQDGTPAELMAKPGYFRDMMLGTDLPSDQGQA